MTIPSTKRRYSNKRIPETHVKYRVINNSWLSITDGKFLRLYGFHKEEKPAISMQHVKKAKRTFFFFFLTKKKKKRREQELAKRDGHALLKNPLK